MSKINTFTFRNILTAKSRWQFSLNGRQLTGIYRSQVLKAPAEVQQSLNRLLYTCFTLLSILLIDLLTQAEIRERKKHQYLFCRNTRQLKKQLGRQVQRAVLFSPFTYTSVFLLLMLTELVDYLLSTLSSLLHFPYQRMGNKS